MFARRKRTLTHCVTTALLVCFSALPRALVENPEEVVSTRNSTKVRELLIATSCRCNNHRPLLCHCTLENPAPDKGNPQIPASPLEGPSSMFGWPLLVHYCDVCHYNTTVTYSATVWIEFHTCSFVSSAFSRPYPLPVSTNF